MANIQVKNVPEKLHNQLRRYAREKGRTVGEIILEAINRELWRREWYKGVSGRASTQLRTSAAQLLEEERRQRDSDATQIHRVLGCYTMQAQSRSEEAILEGGGGANRMSRFKTRPSKDNEPMARFVMNDSIFARRSAWLFVSAHQI